MVRIQLLVLLLAVACSDPVTPEPEVSVVAKKHNNVNKTIIRVNGESVFVTLFEESTSTNGFLNASRDQLADTSAMDFSYATPSTTDPDLVILFQGAGEIPNSALDITNDGATLNVVTPFEVVRCEVSLSTGDFVCNPTAPIAFDLTWSRNGFSQIIEKIKRTEIMGPVTTKFKGEFDQRSATIDGTFGGHVADGLSGNLLDTSNTTVIREITRQLAP